jgi:hypothetical protein
MKKIILVLLLASVTYAAFSQKESEGDEETKKGFKKENLFVGGSGTLSFFNGATIIGGNPYFGYSINKFLDAGIVANFTYAGQRDYDGTKIRQFVYGPGAYLRVFPVRMIFLHAGVEHNIISQKVIYPSGSGFPTEKLKINSNSVLLGGGYTGGREGVGSFFYYFSVMVDVSKSKKSPYTEVLLDGSVRSIPIIRGGIQIPLFRGKNERDPDLR